MTAEELERLLAERELTLADRALPVILGPARRGTLWQADRLSSTWQGVWLASGEPCRIRCLHPRWATEPALRRLFDQATAGLPFDHEGPGLRIRKAPGVPLRELLPAEDPPDDRLLLRLAVAGLAALARAEAQGRPGLLPWPALLHLGPEGVEVIDMGAPLPSDPPGAALRGLAALARDLDPEGRCPTTELFDGLAEAPTLRAEEAAHQLRQALARRLLAERHRLVLDARGQQGRDRASRLLRCLRRLEAFPPPLPSPGPADRSPVLWRARLSPETEPVRIWSRAEGLDPLAGRALLRSWRAAGAPAEQAPPMRWLQAALVLRRARLLLEHGLRAPTARR